MILAPCLYTRRGGKHHIDRISFYPYVFHLGKGCILPVFDRHVAVAEIRDAHGIEVSLKENRGDVFI